MLIKLSISKLFIYSSKRETRQFFQFLTVWIIYQICDDAKCKASSNKTWDLSTSTLLNSVDYSVVSDSLTEEIPQLFSLYRYFSWLIIGGLSFLYLDSEAVIFHARRKYELSYFIPKIVISATDIRSKYLGSNRSGKIKPNAGEVSTKVEK